MNPKTKAFTSILFSWPGYGSDSILMYCLNFFFLFISYPNVVIKSDKGIKEVSESDFSDLLYHVLRLTHYKLYELHLTSSDGWTHLNDTASNQTFLDLLLS